MAQNWIKALELTTFDTLGLGPAYLPVNAPNGFSNALFLLRIINDSGNAITVSYDGVTDHEYIPANTTLHLNAQTNAQPNSGYALFAATTIVYVKGTGGAGTIAVAGYYV